MEGPKEYSCASFIEQEKLQAQLQPWKGDLVKLAAEFNGLDLEIIHEEITCFGDLIKKNHDEGIAAVRKARTSRKATVLEALGSDASSGDESQTLEDALKAEEAREASKIQARIEKLCAVKFLKLCKSQRATINGILAYSMEIQRILDNIIGDAAEDGEDHRSRTNDVDSFYSLDTEQPEDLQSDDGSSDVIREEDLEQAQPMNSVEVEQLKMEKECLLQQNRDLQEQIDKINSNLVRVSAELKEQEPVIKCCAAMRNRFFERAKQQLIGGRYVKLHGTPDMAAIHAGNAAVHQGNWRVDIILAKRGLLTPDNVTKFKFWYGNDTTKAKFPNLIIDMMDMNATMLACLAGTAYTHDKDLQDSFNKYRRVINDLYNDAVQKHLGNWRAAFNAISSNPRAQKAFKEIKCICVEFETKQRYGIHHRVKSL